MTALQETAKQIAQLESDMAKNRNALREIRSRVDKALAAEKEPDVYEQIRDRYGKPFSELQAPDGYFFLFMAGLKEQELVFRGSERGEWWMGVNGQACNWTPETGKSFLILRPAKRIVFVEDPNGDFWEGAAGSMIMGTCPGATRYRREGTP